MAGADRSERWADTCFLREVQYKTDVNLAARQSIYAYQQPPADLAGARLSDGSRKFAGDRRSGRD